MLSPLRGLSEVGRVSVIFLVVSLHLFKGFFIEFHLYTVSVRQTRFRRKSLKITKQFRDLWAFSPEFHGPAFANW